MSTGRRRHPHAALRSLLLVAVALLSGIHATTNTYDDRASFLTYTPVTKWSARANSALFHGTGHWTTSPGASVAFAFAGQQVIVHGSCQACQIHLDDKVATVSSKSGTIFRASNLDSEVEHRISITSGQSNRLLLVEEVKVAYLTSSGLTPSIGNFSTATTNGSAVASASSKSSVKPSAEAASGKSHGAHSTSKSHSSSPKSHSSKPHSTSKSHGKHSASQHHSSLSSSGATSQHSSTSSATSYAIESSTSATSQSSQASISSSSTLPTPSTPLPVIPGTASDSAGADNAGALAAASSSVAAANAQRASYIAREQRQRSGTIIGSVLGGVVALVIVALCLRRRMKRVNGQRLGSPDLAVREARVAGQAISLPRPLSKASGYGDYDIGTVPVMLPIDLSPPPPQVIVGYEIDPDGESRPIPPASPTPTEGGWLRRMKEAPSWGRLYYTRLFYRVDPRASLTAIPIGGGRRSSRQKVPQ